MPTGKPDKKEFAARLVACMDYFGYRQRDQGEKSFKAFAERYGVKPPVVTQWRDAKYIPEHNKARGMAKEFGCDADWLYYGEGSPPAWFNGAIPAVAEIFSPKRRANDDVTAAHVAIESLAAALLKRIPGAASAFLADAKSVTDKMHFSMDHALLGRLSDIAEQVQIDEAKEAASQRRGASARRKKL